MAQSLLNVWRSVALELTVKKFTRLNFADLARKNGWTMMYADGFADGEAYRSRGQQPPAYLLWGFDEYAQGFQAGFHGEAHVQSHFPFPTRTAH